MTKKIWDEWFRPKPAEVEKKILKKPETTEEMEANFRRVWDIFSSSCSSTVVSTFEEALARLRETSCIDGIYKGTNVRLYPPKMRSEGFILPKLHFNIGNVEDFYELEKIMKKTGVAIDISGNF